jgi:hypothetical protein
MNTQADPNPTNLEQFALDNGWIVIDNTDNQLLLINHHPTAVHVVHITNLTDRHPQGRYAATAPHQPQRNRRSVPHTQRGNLHTLGQVIAQLKDRT